MIKGTLLIVEKDMSDRNSLKGILSREVENTTAISDPGRINEILKASSVDIIILGMNFRADIRTGNEGLFWLGEINRIDDTISVIMMSDNGDIELAIRAIQNGAVDYFQKPWDKTKLLAAVSVAWNLRISRLEASRLKIDNLHLKEEINKGGERLVLGASPTMINVMNIVRKVAATDANVLVTGENGTGKEMVAREIHRLSARSGELMVCVDMGSITETLFESELFGHARGAFTDAKEERIGKFELAHKGTIFLDEIGNISLRSQAKLLSVLQNRHVIRIGSNKIIPLNIRLICATNRDLVSMVGEGSFREDLYYRINTIMIEVPPLRDRVDDIPILAGYFLKIHSEKYGRNDLKFSTHALEKLANHDWPGNVRELQHTIEKAVIMSDSSLLRPSDFSFNTPVKLTSLADITLEEMEMKLICDTLRKYRNNMSVVAGKLGITRQTLYNKITRYRL